MEAVIKRLRGKALALLPLALASTVSAHQLDEYVQATIIEIEPGEVRLRINLTPGALVAEPVLGLVDGDRDGVITPDEADAYAGLLSRDLTARVDDREVDLRLARVEFPAPADLRGGSGVARVEYAAAAAPLAAGTHTLTLENRHFPNLSAYLFNAARPASERVRIVRQSRNENQSIGEIQFTVASAASPLRVMAVAAALAAVALVGLVGLRRARRRPNRHGPCADT